MQKPFVTRDSVLEKRGKYSIKKMKYHGDGFFIDKRYQGKLGLSVSLKKINLFFLIILLAFLLLITKVFYLQVVDYDKYSLLSEGNRIRLEFLPSPRGNIYDRNGVQLTENKPKFSLWIEKNFWDNKNTDQQVIIDKIREITGLSEEEIRGKILDSKLESDILIEENIGFEKAIKFKVIDGDFVGLKLQLDSQRSYYNEYGLSHVLGYLGKISQDEWQDLKKNNYKFYDFIGRAGIEKQYESFLRGEYGYIQKEVDALGREVKIMKYKESLAGKDLVLTIDKKFNDKIYQVLKEHLKKINKHKATVVAMDPQTGEVLAMVSMPGFNSNFFSDTKKYNDELINIFNDPNQPLFNRVISGEYPSGSTFKPLMGLAGLEEGIINKWTQVASVGGIKINSWFYPDWKSGGHGLTNITKAIAESVNTFFYYIGGGYKDFKGLGLEKIIDYAHKFYFGKKLGIDLPGESAGFVPTREWKQEKKGEPWYIGDTYHLSIGQGDILVTPLQITSMMATIANGGVLLKPHIVKEIFDLHKNEKVEISKEILNKDFISNKNIKIMQESLRQTVLSGSAASLRGLRFSVAGKTGTAQVGQGAEDHAWFTAYAPYDDPQIVLTVLVENAGGGDVVAVPIAKEILSWYFNNL